MSDDMRFLVEDLVVRLTAFEERRDALLTAALGYARQGWRVIPYTCPVPAAAGTVNCSCPRGVRCASPGKHPVLRHWLDRATVDEATIREWWGGPWGAANVAIVTGRESGIFALDIDQRADGLNSLARLEARHGSLPVTPTQISGGDGRHFLFRHPGARVRSLSGAQAIGRGVEVKGDRGALVVAPSRHHSGTFYRWLDGHGPGDVPIASAPLWLLDLIRHRTAARARDGDFTPPTDSPTLFTVTLEVLRSRAPLAGPDSAGNYRTRCISPRHPDRHPSLDVSIKGFVCRSCGLSGGLHSLATRLGLTPAGIAAIARG
jgi:hypothetical protein